MPISHHFHDCTALLVWRFVVVKWRYIKYEALPFIQHYHYRHYALTIQCRSSWPSMCVFPCMLTIDKKHNELLTNTVIWYGVKCVFLVVLTLHIPTCVWFALACTGVHNGMKCGCTPYSWATIMNDIYGRARYTFFFSRIRILRFFQNLKKHVLRFLNDISKK